MTAFPGEDLGSDLKQLNLCWMIWNSEPLLLSNLPVHYSLRLSWDLKKDTFVVRLLILKNRALDMGFNQASKMFYCPQRVEKSYNENLYHWDVTRTCAQVGVMRCWGLHGLPISPSRKWCPCVILIDCVNCRTVNPLIITLVFLLNILKDICNKTIGSMYSVLIYW